MKKLPFQGRLTFQYQVCALGNLMNAKADQLKLHSIYNFYFEKEEIMKNLKNLKRKEEFKGLSVRGDYTIAERNIELNITDETRGNNEKKLSICKELRKTLTCMNHNTQC